MLARSGRRVRQGSPEGIAHCCDTSSSDKLARVAVTGQEELLQDQEWDFFVSFTAANEQDARWIAAELEAAGHRVLFQHHQFVPGTDFPGLMDQGATRARHTLGVLSPAALEKPLVRREWDASIVADPSGADRRLILVEVAPTPDLVGVLAATVRIPIAGLPLEDARRTLLKGVSAAMSGRRAPQPTVPSWLADRVLSARLPISVAPQRVVERPSIGASLRERLHGGAVVGLVGAGGAGKSTIAQVIAADERGVQGRRLPGAAAGAQPAARGGVHPDPRAGAGRYPAARRDRELRPWRRSYRAADRLDGLRVLQRGSHRGVSPGRRAVLRHRPEEPQDHQSDRGDRRGRLDPDQVPARDLR